MQWEVTRQGSHLDALLSGSSVTTIGENETDWRCVLEVEISGLLAAGSHVD